MQKKPLVCVFLALLAISASAMDGAMAIAMFKIMISSGDDAHELVDEVFDIVSTRDPDLDPEQTRVLLRNLHTLLDIRKYNDPDHARMEESWNKLRLVFALLFQVDS